MKISDDVKEFTALAIFFIGIIVFFSVLGL